jgi:hypothetical protein
VRVLVGGGELEAREDEKHAPKQGLSFPQPVRGAQHCGQVVEIGGHLRMVRTVAVLVDLQRGASMGGVRFEI